MPPDPGRPSQLIGRARFPTTDWSEVGKAANALSQCGQDAMAALIRRYLPVLHAYLMLEWDQKWEDAEDLLHSFVLDKLLQQQLLSRFEQRDIRFRSYLRVVLDNYVCNHVKASRAQKRNPGKLEPMPAADGLAGSEADPSTTLDLIWGRKLLEEAVTELQELCRAEGQDRLWEVFCDHILEPVFRGTTPTPYKDLAPKLGFASDAAVSDALQAAKRRFRAIVRSRVRQIVLDPTEVDEEVAGLFTLFSHGGAG